MASIKSTSDLNSEQMAYHLVRRAQALIASYLNFGTGDLFKYMERDSFQKMADRLTDHYFYRSRDLVISGQVHDLYVALLIMAPVLQRLPLSAKIDWHSGHLISFFRCNVNGKRLRFHFGARTVDRIYQPDRLAENLSSLGVHDGGMAEVLLDLYRRHAGGTALKDMLAHQLFDPLLTFDLKQGFELRHANSLFRLEKEPFSGSVDLRHESASVFNYQLRSVEHLGGRHLEIIISDNCLSKFKEKVKSILESAADPAFKAKNVEQYIRDLVEQTRPARSALLQIKELRQWLMIKLRKIAGNRPEVKVLPELLINLWLQRCDSQLHLKSPSFFLDPKSHSEKTFVKFFSPYREV